MRVSNGSCTQQASNTDINAHVFDVTHIMEGPQSPNASPDMDVSIDLPVFAPFWGEISHHIPRSKPDCPILPSFLTPLPKNIADEEHEYLSQKGALTVPASRLRNRLLQSYIEHIHGFMPVIDLNEFTSMIEGSSGTLSLLLFQAVMFAGVAFVDMAFLREIGFEDRKVAQRYFFNKVKVLYDAGYETDRITIIQSLLLMTLWYESPDSPKDNCYWMSLASYLGSTIGLYKDPTQSRMASSKQRLWKRLAWVCFVRDQVLHLGMSRPAEVKKENFNVPMITLDDFDIDPVSIDVSCVPVDCHLARSSTILQKLAAMCIQQMKLSLCVADVLSLRYSVQHFKQGQEGPAGVGVVSSTNTLQPNNVDLESSPIHQCYLELRTWYTMLPEEAIYSRPSDLPLIGLEETLTVHRGLLHLQYHATMSALYRPQVLRAASWSHSESHRARLEVLQEAAGRITEISNDLFELDLLRFFTTAGCGFLLPALTFYLAGILTGTKEVQQASIRSFAKCMRVLQRLRETSIAADFVSQFLLTALQRHGLNGGQGGFPSGLMNVDSVLNTNSDANLYAQMPQAAFSDSGGGLWSREDLGNLNGHSSTVGMKSPSFSLTAGMDIDSFTDLFDLWTYTPLHDSGNLDCNQAVDNSVRNTNSGYMSQMDLEWFLGASGAHT
ncbi:fungal-specific transcription factor domain-containing protein [Talaromyces proteolyticus]|uniref:Fungal-specific transcription factor domain-containing protein n=1 Tax=Talaromyces proteolyticus TaxID=1131652 RepID=A0AAD4KT72_9EURO|nr:fungal-specific transcription factor domain-containing protein [Talaromyces proteolyticus]KAH8698762.1 fungal-specific transcription factor domain-containing protein [Talaromyces proteolyticus]